MRRMVWINNKLLTGD